MYQTLKLNNENRQRRKKKFYMIGYRLTYEVKLPKIVTW